MPFNYIWISSFWVNLTLAVSNSYDELGRADGSSYVIGDKTMTYDITYKEDSSLVSSYALGNGVTHSYTYDKFERLSSKVHHRHSVNYTYVSGSSLVASAAVSRYDGTNVTFAYTYDALGNITKITENGTTVAEYEYDSLNQLVCEEYPVDGEAYVYTYDKAGNITGKYKFPYAQGASSGNYLVYLASQKETIGSYSYSSGSWGDMLTSFNGTSITYDEIGNPSNWHNALSMSWDKRELTSLVLNNNGTLSFSYNSSGLRTQKTYTNGNSVITHDYLLDGTTILREVISTVAADSSTTDTLYYFYDETGVVGFEYNGTKYHYIKNLQGDIVSIYNNNGNVVVNYTYDAWGKVVSVTGSLASTVGQINPFRYRGYYYDTETGFYYLQSRYYDPSVGRFLNADNVDILEARQDELLGLNLFTYCDNNPVNYFDPTGEIMISTCVLIGIGIGVLIGGTIGSIYGYNLARKLGIPPKDRWKFVVGYGLGGAVVGGVIGGFMGYGIGFLCGASSASGVAVNAISKALSSISQKTWGHIITKKHAWNLVMKTVTQRGVKDLISQALKKGATTLINKTVKKGVVSMIYESVYSYMGQKIVVRYAVIDGIIKISDAWVKTK